MGNTALWIWQTCKTNGFWFEGELQEAISLWLQANMQEAFAQMKACMKSYCPIETCLQEVIWPNEGCNPNLHLKEATSPNKICMQEVPTLWIKGIMQGENGLWIEGKLQDAIDLLNWRKPTRGLCLINQRKPRRLIEGWIKLVRRKPRCPIEARRNWRKLAFLKKKSFLSALPFLYALYLRKLELLKILEKREGKFWGTTTINFKNLHLIFLNYFIIVHHQILENTSLNLTQ